MRVLFLNRVGLDDLGLRHDEFGLFRCAFARYEDGGSEKDDYRLSTPAHADAGGCGRVQVLTNFGQARFRSSKSHLAPTTFLFFLQTHSRACFIVGVRDAILPISFSSAT
jgi:hypothetical protein